MKHSQHEKFEDTVIKDIGISKSHLVPSNEPPPISKSDMTPVRPSSRLNNSRKTQELDENRTLGDNVLFYSHDVPEAQENSYLNKSFTRNHETILQRHNASIVESISKTFIIDEYLLHKSDKTVRLFLSLVSRLI